MMLIALFLFAAHVFNTNADDAYLPPYIEACEFSNENLEQCIKEQIEKSLPEFTKGIPELDVPSTDPVHLDDINIDGNGLKLTFTKALMHGLKGSHLKEFKLKFDGDHGNFKLAFISNMSLTAEYEADGKLLILQIKGKGDALINCVNVDVEIESKLNQVKDNNGKDHLKLGTPSYKYNIEKTTFDLKNLFNGNKELADTTLQFANENWQQLMDDLAPPAIKQIVKTVVKAINKFFASVTTQQILKGYSP
ncbi:circadian clock-controlled protein-like [Bombyx mandarina]|uniref:Circadian clock-controlled protein-like n=1 Tax=Bombyx mandarina TaxID=7092 RepID=A0A6J2K3S4_BOMMA|nr:circadian clock-controlled protein-like [Bombyx mandarina]